VKRALPASGLAEPRANGSLRVEKKYPVAPEIGDRESVAAAVDAIKPAVEGSLDREHAPSVRVEFDQ